MGISKPFTRLRHPITTWEKPHALSHTFGVQHLPSATAALWMHLPHFSSDVITWEPARFSKWLCFIFWRWGGLSLAEFSQDTKSITGITLWHSGLAWTHSCANYSKWTCFSRWVGPDDVERSLPSPTSLWFCESTWALAPWPSLRQPAHPPGSTSCRRQPRHLYRQSPAKAAHPEMTQDLVLCESNCNSQSNYSDKLAWK